MRIAEQQEGSDQIDRRNSPPPLPVSELLVTRLGDAGIRYVVYKNTASISLGLAGITDLDMLVASADLPQFCSIVADLGGVRGYPSSLYDNAIATRQDWYINAGVGQFVHLDVANGITIGRKFCKRYHALGFDDLSPALLNEVGGPHVPIVTPAEEARIAILRDAFRLPASGFGHWIKASGELARLLYLAAPRGMGTQKFSYQIGSRVIDCEVRTGDNKAEINGSAIRNLRRAVRARTGAGALAAPLDALIHHIRRISFGLAKRITAAKPGRAVAKRRLKTGIIVALIGPDGVGKSTQSATLAALFQRKFRCTSVYLGSNDGSWMKFRGFLGPMRRPKTGAKSAHRRPAKNRSRLHTYGSVLWRLIIAVQRYMASRKAVRLAQSGAIAIADRWPQSLAHGMLDGPSSPPATRYRLAGTIWRIENRIYQAMGKYRPSLTIHIDCTFATSHARKPGDILQEDFERRIELMREMRQRDPQIRVVDGSGELDEVTGELYALIWSHIEQSNLVA